MGLQEEFTATNLMLYLPRNKVIGVFQWSIAKYFGCKICYLSKIIDAIIIANLFALYDQ